MKKNKYKRLKTKGNKMKDVNIDILKIYLPFPLYIPWEGLSVTEIDRPNSNIPSSNISSLPNTTLFFNVGGMVLLRSKKTEEMIMLPISLCIFYGHNRSIIPTTLS
jgi:hypothetical protein